MYTVAFDESTGFEKESKKKTTIPFIGGFIYYSNTEKRRRTQEGDLVEPERLRIFEYLKAACKTAGTRFPMGLHSGPGVSGNQVAKTKKEIQNTLPEFISKGTYKGRELVYVTNDRKQYADPNKDNVIPFRREGSYSLMTLAQSANMNKINNLFEDGIASNTYLSMVEDFITKSVFLNESIQDAQKVVIEAPTRKIPNSKDAKIQEDYERLGYKYNDKLDIWQVMEPGDAKQMLRLITKEIGSSTNVHIKCESISVGYNLGRKVGYEYAFYFLADLICDYINKRAKKGKECADSIQAAMKALNKSDNNQFFFYDASSEYYNRAYKALLKGDIFEVLSNVYEGNSLPLNQAVEYYSSKKFPNIEEKAAECSLFELREFIDKLNQFRFTTNLRQHKLIYLYRQISSISSKKEVSKEDLYNIQDIGVSAYTHLGDFNSADICFQECERIHNDRYVDDTTFNRTRKRRISGLIDSFEFETAEKEALALIPKDWEEAMIALQIGETTGEQYLFEARNLDECRTLSTLGQIYSQMRDSRAGICFSSALKSLEDIRAYDNYNITLSFYLHYLIDANKKLDYERYASVYFGNKSLLEEQLSFILAEAKKENENRGHSSFSMGFAMYVFIKAFYYFYIHDSDHKNLANELTEIRQLIETFDNDMNIEEKWMRGHPWELILKYSALIELETAGNIKKSKSLIKAAKTSVEKEAQQIIERVNRFGEAEYYHNLLSKKAHDKDRDVYNGLVSSLYNELFSNKSEETALTGKGKYELLSDTFHYMYR